MSKLIKVLAASAIMMNAFAEEDRSYTLCINDALEQILKTDMSKKQRLVIFNESDGDLELKDLLHQLLPESRNKIFYVIDLDVLWDWDRKNGMKFIYKILDLMNRNYKIESINIDLKDKYLEEANIKCEGLS